VTPTLAQWAQNIELLIFIKSTLAALGVFLAALGGV
jgi:hypothetical protein